MSDRSGMWTGRWAGGERGGDGERETRGVLRAGLTLKTGRVAAVRVRRRGAEGIRAIEKDVGDEFASVRGIVRDRWVSTGV